MTYEQQLQHTIQLRQLLSNPNRNLLDRSYTCYELATSLQNMSLMEPTSVTWPVEQIFHCQESIECFEECYWLRFHILGDHALVREAGRALERAREVLVALEESYEGISGAPAA